MNQRASDGTDAALLRLVAGGDELALEELYDRHAGWVLARLLRLPPAPRARPYPASYVSGPGGRRSGEAFNPPSPVCG